MGNSFRTHFAHIVVSILLFVACFLMVACNVEEPGMLSWPELGTFMPQPQATATPDPNPNGAGGLPTALGNHPGTDPRYMNVEIRCEDVRRDACGLLVTLNAIHDDIELDLRLHGDDGVQFLPNLDVLPQGGDESTIARVKLRQGESRQILFPYVPAALDLPGAYQVIVLATEADTKNLYAYDNRARAYMMLNEIGEYHLLPSEFEFNNNFRSQFTNGVPEMGMGYWIQFEGGERPHRGNIWVRVDSQGDEYQPEIEITGGDAITFLNDGIWKPTVSNAGMTASRKFPSMNAGGSRVARFPFELDRNGRLLDGEYAFLVRQIESGISRTETMPVVVQLFSDPQYPNEHWLGAHTIPPGAATATPNATVVASDENNILAAHVGFGGKYKDLDENTADGVCSSLVEYQLPNDQLPEPRWTRYIANYNGTICQAYLDFVIGSVAITWPDFEEFVVEYNENLNSPSDKLEDHRVYILPHTDQ